MASTGERWRLGDRRVRRVLIACAAVLAVSLSIDVGLQPWQRARATEARCSSWAADSASRARSVVGRGRAVVVIGDSYTRGYGLQHPDRSWPAYLAAPLHARVFTDGFDGSGFTDSNLCGVAYSTRASRALAKRPSLVVVEGGLNDAYLSDRALREGVRSLVRELRGTRLIVVGPPRTPVIGTRAERVDHTLREMSGHLEFQYVSTYRWRLPYLSDGVHLTLAGHQRFARRVAEAVSNR